LISQPEVIEIDDQSETRAEVLQDDRLEDLEVAEETGQPEETRPEVQPKEEVKREAKAKARKPEKVVKQFGRIQISMKAPPEIGINCLHILAGRELTAVDGRKQERKPG
jgi:predicted house-cleaning NTP pyrophosphatase (Maf/HAM1 superfamily)